jgi:hypothetical protein
MKFAKLTLLTGLLITSFNTYSTNLNFSINATYTDGNQFVGSFTEDAQTFVISNFQGQILSPQITPDKVDVSYLNVTSGTQTYTELGYMATYLPYITEAFIFDIIPGATPSFFDPEPMAITNHYHTSIIHVSSETISSISDVPEPATITLLGIGLLGIGRAYRKKRIA